MPGKHMTKHLHEDDDAIPGTRAFDLRAEIKMMRTQLDRLEREVHHEEEAGEEAAIEQEAELPDTTDMILTHSFSHESAYYSICDPAQRSKAYAVLLCVITILYFVMLPGVVPLVADDRDENHILAELVERFNGEHDDIMFTPEDNLMDDMYDKASRAQSEFCYEFTYLILFCVIASFADNVTPCLRGIHELIRRDCNISDVWYFLPLLAIAICAAISTKVCWKTVDNDDFSTVYYEAVFPVFMFLVCCVSNIIAPRYVRLFMFATVLVIDVQLMTFACTTIYMWGADEIWYSLEFVLFILITADIDEWVERTIGLFETLYQMCVDARTAAATVEECSADCTASCIELPGSMHDSDTQVIHTPDHFEADNFEDDGDGAEHKVDGLV